MSSTLRVAFATVLLLLVSLPAFPQAELGRITGSVYDQSGGVIAGATVTVTDAQRGEARVLTADDAGVYFAPSLLPGTYSVRAEFRGFKTIERQNVVLETGKEVRVDLVLQTGETTEKVTVTEALPLVATTDAVLGGAVSNADINDLPLNGRNYQDLLTVRPGVVAYAGGGSWTQSTNGVRPDANGWMIDGQLNANPADGRSVINFPSPLTDAATLLPIDAIQEFNIQVNPKAETGWKTGAIVNVAIRSGTNTLHGTAYAFGRDGVWDARNYFNPAPNVVPPLDLVQYGATVGGPIKKDKLFFFGGYEAYRNEVGNPLVISAPTTALTSDPGSSIPAAIAALQQQGIVISSVSQSLLNIYPANPTSSTSVNTAFSNSNTSYNGIGKINYRINDRHTISGFLFWSQYEGIGEDRIYASDLFLLHTPVRAIANNYNWIYTHSASLVNEARFGFNRNSLGNVSGDVGTAPTAYGLNTGVTDKVSWGLPNIAISGLTALGSYANTPINFGPNPFYRWADNVSYFRGRHAFKFGGEFFRAHVLNSGTNGTRGGLRFNGGQLPQAAFYCPPPNPTNKSCSTGLEDFLAGKPSQGTLAFGSDPARDFTRWQFAAFAQDDWRVTSKLTLNLGLRYEYAAPPHEVNGLVAGFDPTLGLIQQGKQISSIYSGDHKDFSPRVGLAWDVTGKGTTVIRAGGSLMFETENVGLLDSGSADPTGALLNGVPGPGNIGRTTVTYTPNQLNYPLAPGAAVTIFPIGVGSVTCTTAAPCNAASLDRNFKTPYIISWTLGIEHAFTNNLSLEVEYVGDHGSKLPGLIDINAPPAGAGYCLNSPLTAAQLADACNPSGPDFGVVGTAEQQARPFYKNFPYLQYIIQTANLDRSNYNGLQTTLTQRVSHGLSLTAGYTYSHALDTSSINNFNYLPQNNPSGNRNAEYASSDFDIRHRLTLAITYTLPGKKSPGQLLEGWQINSLVALQGSQPWTIVDTNNDFNGVGDSGAPGNGADRWNFYGTPADFKSPGPNAIPFFPGTSNAKCLSQATANGPGAVASLSAAGCYAQGNSILIPPAPGTFGTMGRNLFPDRGFKNVNMSISKQWKFRERYGAQFRAEFFNVFNHPNFANPYGSVGGFGYNDPSKPSNFGCGCATPDVAAGNPIIGSGSMRAIQLGLKLAF